MRTCLSEGYRFGSTRKAIWRVDFGEGVTHHDSQEEAESAADAIAQADERTVVVEEHGD